MISGLQVIQQEAEALKKLALHFPENFPKAVQCLRNIKGKVVCSGMGKSGHVARKVASTLSSTGTPSFFLHPSEAMHGDLGALTESDALIAFSYSGETLEILKCIQHSKVGVRLVVTSRPESSLAFCCDVVLIVPPTPEACPMGLAPTSSTLMMLALGDALAMTLSSMIGFTKERYKRLHPGGSLGQKLLRVEQIMRSPAPLLTKEALPEEIIKALIQEKSGCVGLINAKGELVKVLDKRDGSDLIAACQHSPQTPFWQQSHLDQAPLVLEAEMMVEKALEISFQHQLNQLFVRNTSGEILGLFCQEDGLKVGPG